MCPRVSFHWVCCWKTSTWRNILGLIAVDKGWSTRWIAEKSQSFTIQFGFFTTIKNRAMKSLLQKSPDLYIYLLLHFTITHVKKNNKYWNSFVDSLLHCREQCRSAKVLNLHRFRTLASQSLKAKNADTAHGALIQRLNGWFALLQQFKIKSVNNAFIKANQISHIDLISVCALETIQVFIADT